LVAYFDILLLAPLLSANKASKEQETLVHAHVQEWWAKYVHHAKEVLGLWDEL